MREHMGLFRGKRIDTGDWVEGFFIVGTDCVFLGRAFICERIYVAFDDDDELTLGGFIEVDPNTIGECTGLRDKNGKLIFEGNIVKDHNGVVYPVVFDLTGYYLKYAAPHSHGFHYDLLPLSNYWHAHGAVIEIIGNIHDNPELLKGGE